MIRSEITDFEAAPINLEQQQTPSEQMLLDNQRFSEPRSSIHLGQKFNIDPAQLGNVQYFRDRASSQFANSEQKYSNRQHPQTAEYDVRDFAQVSNSSQHAYDLKSEAGALDQSKRQGLMSLKNIENWARIVLGECSKIVQDTHLNIKYSRNLQTVESILGVAKAVILNQSSDFGSLQDNNDSYTDFGVGMLLSLKKQEVNEKDKRIAELERRLISKQLEANNQAKKYMDMVQSNKTQINQLVEQGERERRKLEIKCKLSQRMCVAYRRGHAIDQYIAEMEQLENNQSRIGSVGVASLDISRITGEDYDHNILNSDRKPNFRQITQEDHNQMDAVYSKTQEYVPKFRNKTSLMYSDYPDSDSQIELLQQQCRLVPENRENQLDKPLENAQLTPQAQAGESQLTLAPAGSLVQRQPVLITGTKVWGECNGSPIKEASVETSKIQVPDEQQQANSQPSVPLNKIVMEDKQVQARVQCTEAEVQTSKNQLRIVLKSFEHMVTPFSKRQLENSPVKLSLQIPPIPKITEETGMATDPVQDPAPSLELRKVLRLLKDNTKLTMEAVNTMWKILAKILKQVGPSASELQEVDKMKENFNTFVNQFNATYIKLTTGKNQGDLITQDQVKRFCDQTLERAKKLSAVLYDGFKRLSLL